MDADIIDLNDDDTIFLKKPFSGTQSRISHSIEKILKNLPSDTEIIELWNYWLLYLLLYFKYLQNSLEKNNYLKWVSIKEKSLYNKY